jgi:arylamine N-acetyltransferase
VKLEDQDWVTDVGFGDGFIEPLLLKDQKLEQRGFSMSLELQPDGYWQYGNHKFGGAPNFDFRIEPAEVSLL